MKGKILATLGLGAALVLGNASNGLASDEEKCSDKNVDYVSQLISHANYSLANDNDREALIYLNYINNPENDPRGNNFPTVDDIEPALKGVVSNYIECEELHHDLYVLAETFYEEEKKAMAVEYLKEELGKVEVKDSPFPGDQSFSYHVYMVYEDQLEKTDSIEDTHKYLRENYEYGTWVNFLGHHFKANMEQEKEKLEKVLKGVESKLPDPNKDSKLMDKIKNYHAMKYVEWYV